MLNKLSSLSATPNGITNILIWDVPKRTKFNLFAEGELAATEFVQSITFEQRYDATKKQFIFNDYTHVMRNEPLFERIPRDKVIVNTYNQATDQQTLWICNKWGISKSKLMPFAGQAQWHLDMYNNVIRIMEWQNNDVRIIEAEW